MTTTPMATKAELKLTDLKGKSEQELNLLVEDGSIDHILFDENLRIKFINRDFEESIPATPETPPAEKKEEAPPVVPMPTPVSTPEPVPPPVATPTPTPEPPKTEELTKQIDALRDLVDIKQKQIDKDNSEKGKLGTERKRLEDELNRIKKQLEETQKKVNAQGSDFPQVVPPPVPKDQEEIVDPNSEYNQKMREYWASSSKAFERIKVLEMEKNTLAEQLNSVSSKLQAYEEKISSIEQTATKSEVDKSETELFSEIEKLQGEDESIRTSILFTKLNKILMDHGNDPSYMSTIPPTDIEKFRIIRELILGDGTTIGYGYFDKAGVFHKSQAFESLKERNEIYQKRKGKSVPSPANKPPAETPAAPNPAPANRAITMPNTPSGSPPVPLSKDEKSKRLDELLDKSEAKLTNASEEQEIEQLQIQLGYAVPKATNKYRAIY